MRPVLISIVILAAIGVGWFSISQPPNVVSAVAPSSYNNLTPDQLVAWCGKPLEDQFSKSDPVLPHYHERAIVYPARETGMLVYVEFVNSDVTSHEWRLTNVRTGPNEAPRLTLELSEDLWHINLDCLPEVKH